MTTALQWSSTSGKPNRLTQLVSVSKLTILIHVPLSSMFYFIFFHFSDVSTSSDSAEWCSFILLRNKCNWKSLTFLSWTLPLYLYLKPPLLLQRMKSLPLSRTLPFDPGPQWLLPFKDLCLVFILFLSHPINFFHFTELFLFVYRQSCIFHLEKNPPFSLHLSSANMLNWASLAAQKVKNLPM